MAMSGSSLAARWRAKLAAKFGGAYDDAFMQDMAQCIVDEIVQNMQIQTVVTTSGTPTVHTGTGVAGGGVGVIS